MLLIRRRWRLERQTCWAEELGWAEELPRSVAGGWKLGLALELVRLTSTADLDSCAAFGQR